MATLPKPRWMIWAVSLGAMAVACALTAMLTPHLALVPSALILLGVIAASWSGNFVAGLLAAVLGALLCQHIHVRHTHEAWGYDDFGNVALIILTGAFISTAFAWLRSEQQRRSGEEERFRAVFNQQFQFMAVVSPEGDVLEVNDSPLRRTGVTREEVLGRKFWETPWWRDLSEMRRRWPERLREAAQSAGPVFSEDQFQTAGGEMRVADAAITAVKNVAGAVQFFIIQASDITERKAAEEALRKTNAGLKLLAELAEDFLAANDPGTVIQTAFDKLKQQLPVDGYFSFLVAPSARELLLLSCAGIPAETAQRLERLAVGKAVCGRVAHERKSYLAGNIADATEPELELVRALGFTAYTCHPLLIGERLLGTLSFASRQAREFAPDDVELMRIVGRYAALAIQRLSVEQELRRTNERLEQRVAERTGSLETSLKSIEELLYTIAHDLRAPNRAMEGYAELLQLEYGSRLDANARIYLERIVKAAHQNDELICDLLQFGRLLHTEVPTSRLDPRAVMNETLAELDREIKGRHATIELKGEWRDVIANPMLLKQVFLHLLTNALRYVPQEREPQITISAVPCESRVAFRIEDNGTGIAPELHEQAFKPFVRLVYCDRVPGTGMGLAIVRKAVARLHGEVGVESKPGRGSCFWVELQAA